MLHLKNPEVVKRIVALQKYGTLSKEEIFSVFNQKHLEEAIALFDVFYHAKDFDTFYKAACWSRVNFNPGLFAYAFTLAVVHHKSFLGIVLPPPYEIFPQLFVDSELIEKAYQIKLVKESKKAEGPVEPVVITVNGSGFYPYYHYDFGRHSDHQGSNSDVYEYRVHPEKRVSYFTEDVALNSYNYYRHIYNPFFLNETHDYNTEGRGELFLYHHQQIIARYFLERLSNNLFSIKPITFTHPIRYGYNSNLRYPNGKPFPIRPDTMRVNEDTNFEFQLIDDFYRRLFDAVDLGFIITAAGEKLSLRESTGVDYLGHLIEATASSVNPKFYGKIFNLAMKAFGHVVDFNYNNDVAPGVLENYETALRDPLYYRLVASLINLYNRHKSHLESYNHEDLSFPGVKINGVEVDELVTFFENFDFDITSAVPTKSMFDDVVIKVRQYRLNHKPFTYKINITSDNNTGAMVRVFIGSKYDVEGRLFNINEKRKYMVEIDRFPIEGKRA